MTQDELIEEVSEQVGRHGELCDQFDALRIAEGIVETVQKASNGLELFAVRNRDGQWFRARGYHGYGDSWVDSLEKAKVYGRIAPARSRITWWAKNYPQYGIPDLVRLHITHLEVMDEAQRVKKSMEAAATRKEQEGVREKKSALKRAEQDLVTAQDRLKRAKQCGVKDYFSPRQCTLLPGHDGVHEDDHIG